MGSGVVHKCTLFADDILLFITSPLTSLPNICKLLDNFGTISGLKVKYGKSRAWKINVPDHLLSRLQEKFQFICNDTVIPYLGVNLAASVDRLYAANFPHYRELEEDPTHWGKMDLSWLGRVTSTTFVQFPFQN